MRKKTNLNAILLDVGLPDMDGRDVCRVLRRKGIHASVIMLTALNGDADTVLGLDSGANDYVTKPFRLGVLLAPLRAHIRQHEMSEDTSFSVGPYIFRPAIKVLQRSDGKKEVNLSENLLRVPQRGGRGSGCDDVPARGTSRQLGARITNGKGPVVRPALFYIAPAFFRLSSSALSRGSMFAR